MTAIPPVPEAIESILSAMQIGMEMAKEEKTKNPVMARVGDRTRTQERILRNDSKVKHTTLEFNSGGHFADAQKRLAKAVNGY